MNPNLKQVKFYLFNLGLNNENINHSRVLKIKNKYFDIKSGQIKTVVNNDEDYILKKKK
jgi:hypothetical protein